MPTMRRSYPVLSDSRQMNIEDELLIVSDGLSKACCDATENFRQVLAAGSAVTEKASWMIRDIRKRLHGLPESQLEGEGGLAAATRRLFDALENSACDTGPCYRCGKPTIWSKGTPDMCRECLEVQRGWSRKHTGADEYASH